MTWQGKFRVTDVTYAPVEIVAIAEGDDVTSNTEGKITSVELRFTVEGDSTKVRAGDEFTASGHFSA